MGETGDRLEVYPLLRRRVARAWKSFTFVGVRIRERISLRHFSGKYSVAEGALRVVLSCEREKVSSLDRRECEKFGIRATGPIDVER
jgi:hypothetical protein